MAQTVIELTKVWQPVSIAASFNAQNLSTAPIELIFSTGAPLETSRGFVIEHLNGVDDSMGVGDLYGRGNGSLVTVSE